MVFGGGGLVLDYGFGPGENMIHLLRLGYHCEGLEVSKNAKMLVERKLERYPEFEGFANLHLLEDNQSSLPFGDDYFDYVLSNQVVYFLAHEEKIKRLFSEFRRVLKPKGRLIITMMSRLNHFCTKGIEIAPNIYKYLNKDSGYLRYVYILYDENHARELFKTFEIHEIGWFDNHYCGASGHHFVILAYNSKE